MNQTSQPAVPLIALTEAEFKPWLDSQPESVRRWLDATDFKAQEASVSLLPSSGGGLDRVLTGISSQPDMWALAGLPAVLPAGSYQLQVECSEAHKQQLLLGYKLACYRFDRYLKPTPKWPSLTTGDPALDAQAEHLCQAQSLVRDLVNTPSEDLGPQHMAEQLKQLADEFDADYHEVVGDQLLEQNFPAIHAVGRAAQRPPALLGLDWGSDKHPLLALVGKGVCFDSGGLDLKSAVGMRFMKKDMGGGAHVMGLARLVMQAGLPVRLKVLIPAVENAVSGNAYRPGDVIATRAGLSVEIGNTDAEGRVVLSDALQLASEHKPDLIIDFATLTGAARVALGPDVPPLFCNRDALAEELVRLSARVDDPLWRMPLFAGYRSMIESNIADLSNIGDSPMGGCITAALFLERFVDPAVDWCHIDTFAWNRGNRPGRPEGGEALGLRAVFAYLRQRYTDAAV